MPSRTRRIAVTAASMAACAAAATGSGTTPAAAAGNPYTPSRVCGPGFGVIDRHTLRSNDGVLLGTSYLLYRASTGENCATVIKRRHIGRPTFTAVSLKRSGSKAPWVVDSGNFKFYAGPVRTRARGKCVRFGASISMPGNRRALWISPFGHCG